MTKRKTLTLTDEAAGLLPKLAGYHDQGLYISQLIVAAAGAAQLVPTKDPEEVQTEFTQEDYQAAFAQAQDADLATLRRMVRKLIRDVAAMRTELERRGG